MKIHLIIAATVLFLVTACAEDPGAGAEAEQVSRTLQPADKALADIYNRSCRSCHTVLATGAPLTGDSATWATRQEKGMNTLLDNVVNGFGGMPPFGLCMDCDVEQFEALIEFMVEDSAP